MANHITNRDNPKVKYAAKLAASAAFRQQENSFLAEGLKLCPELARGCLIKEVYYTASALEKAPALEQLPCEQHLIEPHIAEKLADVKTNQGVFGVFEMPHAGWEQITPGGHYLALERVQDPGNVGALLRSAAAFGFDAVVLGPGCASPWSPKTLRASMGAAARIPVVEVEALPDALARMNAVGITTLAAALYNSRPLDEVGQQFPDGVCVVIGSEGQGLSEETVSACTAAVRIPITERVESLNAGVAGSVLLWHFRGQL